MNNVWIQNIDIFTENGYPPNSIVNVFIPIEEYEIDKNMFPTGCEPTKKFDFYLDDSNIINLNKNEFENKFKNKNGIYCIKNFEVKPLGNYVCLNMNKFEYENSLELYFMKNFRIYNQYLIENRYE